MWGAIWSCVSVYARTHKYNVPPGVEGKDHVLHSTYSVFFLIYIRLKALATMTFSTVELN